MRGTVLAVLRQPSLALGIFLLSLIFAMAIAAPFVYPGSPWDMAGAPFTPPGDAEFPLGTDSLGRDVAAAIAHGAPVSLLIGGVSTLVALTLGVMLGAVAGFAGGRVDDAVMRFAEFFQTIPSFVLAVVLVAIFRPSLYSIVAAIAIVSWPPVARVTRAEFMTLRQREFVQAARVLGHSTPSIIFRTILPNALSPVIVLASLMIATAILTESALSFLGLGDPNRMSWGFMIGSGRSVIRLAWWVSVFPGISIFVTVLGLNLVGEGLNTLLNPRLARRRPVA